MTKDDDKVKLLDGYTLMHEHMSIDLSPGDIGTESFDLLCRDLREAYRFGVRNIIDMTNRSMGRSPEHIKKLIDATGINIVMSTGYYLEKHIEKYVRDRSVEELAGELVRNLTAGIGNSGMKAGVIGEIAWNHEGPCEMELKSWEAMCIAAQKTGAVISTHTSCDIQQIPQAEYLIAHGIPLDRIVIGHIEFYPDDESLKKLLRMGVYIGLDMIGKSSGKGDEYRADTMRKLKEWGCLSQVVMSLDICRTEDLKSAGGYGYAHLFETFIPMLKDRGFAMEDIELVLKDNPRRIFS